MPTRASRICRQPGCTASCSGPYCASHRRAVEREYDRRRGSHSVRGYGRRHERWRKLILARDPLCRVEQRCGRGLDRPGDNGHLPSPSTVADHVLPLREGGEWSMENGQGLCAACHGWKTRREQRRG